MKVEQIKAYRAEDAGLFESEADAIYDNIETAIMNDLHIKEPSLSIKRVLKWFKDYPDDVKYIQNSIKKLLPEHFVPENYE